MTGHGFRLWVIAVALIVMGLLPVTTQAQYPNYYRRVLLVYVSGGPVLPVAEDEGDEHDLGFNLGLGLGFVLSSKGPVSPELDIRYNFYRLPKKVSTNRYILNESDNEYSFGLEGRFRFVTEHRIHPFASAGLGVYHTSEDENASSFMGTFGGGADLALDRKESMLLFAELRYVAAKRGLLRLDIGIRIG